MSNIDKRPYRADGGDISTGRLREIADNPYGDEEKCWLAKRVLALLDELEAKDNQLSVQRDYYEGVIADGSKRISELEAREVKLPDISNYLSDVTEPTLDRALRLTAKGVRSGDVAAIRAAGIRIKGVQA